MVVMCGTAMMMTSCSTKTSAISNLRSLTYDIRDNGSTYTVQDWMDVKDRYSKINDKISSYDLTTEEKEEVSNLKGQCVGYFAKGIVGNAAQKVVDGAAQVKGLVDGVKQALGK